MIETITVLTVLIGILYRYWTTTGRTINIGCYVMSFYILSLLSSFYVDNDNMPYARLDWTKYSFEASFYFLGTLLLYLLPILKFNSNNIQLIKPVNLRLFNMIAYIFIFFGFVSYVYYVPILIHMVSLGDSLANLRALNDLGTMFFDIDPLFFVVSLFCQFSPIIITFYFYSLAFTPNGYVFNRLLLFSSTAYIVSALSAVGRTGLIMWPIYYIFSYLLFRKFLSNQNKSKSIHLLLIVASICVIIFIPITFSRYGEGVMLSILHYIGSQFGYFNQYYQLPIARDNSISHMFPIFRFIFGEGPRLSNYDLAMLNVNAYGVNLNQFATFIGHFIVTYDKATFFFISVVYNLILYFVFLKNKVVSFGKVILITLVSQIPLQGIFYYQLAFTVCNIYMILTILLSLLFKKKIRLFSRNKLYQTALSREN